MSWLKTLRLHKYYPKLSALSYDALLSLNEDRLGDITEGARRKILLNVQKLGGRHVLLHDIMGVSANVFVCVQCTFNMCDIGSL